MKNTDVKFGIIITTFKREKIVHRAIESVLKQTYGNFQLCIVEDCSPDNTSQTMSIYDKYENVKYIRLETNSGLSICRNTGLDYLMSKEINCDYITWLDDDDYFVPNFLENALKYINEIKCPWLVMNKVSIDGKKITKVQNYGYVDYQYEYLTRLKMEGDATMIIASSLIGNNIRFPNKIRSRTWLFLIQLGQKSKMYVVDFDAKIGDYLEDGLTKKRHKKDVNAKRLTESEQERILKEINIDNNDLEYINISFKLLQLLKTKNYKNVLKFSRKFFIVYLKKLFY